MRIEGVRVLGEKESPSHTVGLKQRTISGVHFISKFNRSPSHTVGLELSLTFACGCIFGSLSPSHTVGLELKNLPLDLSFEEIESPSHTVGLELCFGLRDRLPEGKILSPSHTVGLEQEGGIPW